MQKLFYLFVVTPYEVFVIRTPNTCNLLYGVHSHTTKVPIKNER